MAVVLTVVVALIVLLVGSGIGTVLYARDQLSAPSDSHGQPVAFEVRPGAGIDQVASDLESQGLIRSSFWFVQYARLRGLGDALRRGRFMLDDGMAAGTVITVLEGEPTPSQHTVRLAEGLNAEQMAHAIAAAPTGISPDDYLSQVRSGQFAQSFLSGRPPGASLEGFLFPDTYQVRDHLTAREMVQMQLDDFGRRVVAPGLLPAAGGYQTVVLASILEREARDPADLPVVAGVIANRLAQGMRLEVDATVLYGLHRLGRDGTTVDTSVDTPYNTYVHPGLPPTPISNPGIRALQAAANPARTPYLYYVSDGCGHNHYSVTPADHARNVALYVGKPCPTGPGPSPS